MLKSLPDASLGSRTLNGMVNMVSATLSRRRDFPDPELCMMDAWVIYLGLKSVDFPGLSLNISWMFLASAVCAVPMNGAFHPSMMASWTMESNFSDTEEVRGTYNRVYKPQA